MRRKSSRNASKTTPESKTETRKSTRTRVSRRRKSPSVEIEESTTPDVNDSINDDKSDNLDDTTSTTQEESNNEVITDPSVENESKNEDEKGGHTPPHIESTGNEAPKIDDLDAEKGKSKGISNSKVEENSEIQMNSVTSINPDEANKNEINPDVNISLKENDEISENQNVDKELKNEVCLDDTVANNQSENPIVNQPENQSVNQLENQIVNQSENQIVNQSENQIVNESDSKNEESSENSEVTTCAETESDNKCTAEIKECENVNVESDKKETEIEQSNNNVEVDEAEEGEIRESKSDEENEVEMKQIPSIKVKKTSMKVKLRRDSLFDSVEKLNEADFNLPAKKMKWDPEVHECLKVSFHDMHRLDTEDFKSLSLDLKLAEENEVKLEEIYQPKIIRERVKSMDTNSEEIEKPAYSKQLSTPSSEDPENTNIIAINRKISIVDDSASKLKPPPSPAKQPVSQILFISNLVRPFTIKQLKELLERTGTIKEGGFWTDRIKSKCYAWYNSSEEAEATRNALHGVNWPVGNGKKLIIEYATEEQMEREKNPPAQPAPQPPQAAPPVVKSPQKEITEPVYDQRNGDKREERKRKDSEKERERTKPATREWDVGKESNKDRNRSRSRDRRRRHSGKRSPTPLKDFIAKKQRKLEESVPQKLMDDLFQRTKAMPCIYWQPLSPDEISIKQQQRLTRMEEHKRRLEENSRTRGVGGRDRGSYRRRYD